MDLNLKYKMGVGRIVKKRDRLYGKMSFNARYLDLLEKRYDARTDKQLKMFELGSKKGLLPLEMQATPTKFVNQELRAEALAEFVKKQIMPRRAIEQTAKRKTAKQGEAAGDAYRKQKLGALDAQLANYEKQLLTQYPDMKETEASDAAIKQYATATDNDARLQAELAAKLAKEKADAVSAAKAKMAGKDAKLKAALDAANKQLDQHYAPHKSKLADGQIMSIKNMKMYFSGIKAVDDLSFDIKEGDIFGLIGPNGAGKTTLFNCITQFYKATEGEIYYRDRFNNIIDLRNYQSHDVALTGIVRTFQNLAMVPLIPVIDNLMIGAHIYYSAGIFHQLFRTKKLRLEEKANRANAMEILERLGLTNYAYQLPMNLSYGVLKKVELARTLMSRPRMIILDEPAAGLNDTETEELTEVIRQVRSDFDCTIFLVEHDMNLVMNVCDTVCAISFGKMLGIGTPEEIQQNPLVQQAYLGEEGSE